MTGARAGNVEPVHLFPATSQPSRYVTACGVAGDDATMTAPIVRCSHVPWDITCRDCLRILGAKL